jgi:hypothetical protein
VINKPAKQQQHTKREKDGESNGAQQDRGEREK